MTRLLAKDFDISITKTLSIMLPNLVKMRILF